LIFLRRKRESAKVRNRTRGAWPKPCTLFRFFRSFAFPCRENRSFPHAAPPYSSSSPPAAPVKLARPGAAMGRGPSRFGLRPAAAGPPLCGCDRRPSNPRAAIRFTGAILPVEDGARTRSSRPRLAAAPRLRRTPRGWLQLGMVPLPSPQLSSANEVIAAGPPKTSVDPRPGSPLPPRAAAAGVLSNLECTGNALAFLAICRSQAGGDWGLPRPE